MPTIWFTSDQHFSHENIIKYCNRPFQSSKEMDDCITNNFNSRVGKNDITFHLGDLSFKNTEPFLKQLNGTHYLIKGNHDEYPKGFQWVKDTFVLRIENLIVFMSHFAHRVWPESHYGSIHLFGHSHGRIEPFGRSFDVGVDTNNFYPYSLEEIIEKAKTLKPNFIITDKLNQ